MAARASAGGRVRPRETDLYEPVKALLERQGYTVKGEIGTADIVARRGGEDPVASAVLSRVEMSGGSE